MNVLIVYASKEGQTASIAEFIAQTVRRHGYQASVYSCASLPVDFSTSDYDAAIIGGSIHINAYPRHLPTFIEAHKDWLNQVPSALFTVCMAIHSKNEKERDAAQRFGEKLAEKTHWQPGMMETFAGAIKYTRYGLITRWLMRSIAKKEGGDTDTSRDYEYTDWNAVALFCEHFLSKIPARRSGITGQRNKISAG